MYSVSCVCCCDIYLNSPRKQLSHKSKEDEALSGTFSVVARFGNLIADVSALMEFELQCQFYS